MATMVLDHSVNVIAVKKNGINYAMCCAWAQMVDYDKITCLLGTQSVTGHNIKKGDIIGFSALEKSQKDIAEKIGDNHSTNLDKLANIKYTLKDTAITIDGAKTMVVCRVIDVLHLEKIEVDNLLYLEIIETNENEGQFLHMSDF